MLTVDYYTLQSAVCDLLVGESANSPDTTDFTKLRRMFSRRLATAWERAWWPDLMLVQEREFRATWASGTTYAAGDEVWYPPTQAYYVSMQGSNTGNVPATLSGTTYGNNYAYWFPAKVTPTGSDWVDGTAYVLGDVVRNPADDLIYGCFVAHTASSSLDATKFAVLAPFDRYVAFAQAIETAIGTVRGVFTRDPRNVRNPDEVGFLLTTLGVNVVDGPAQPWLWFRKRVPRLFGAVFDSTATYTADVSQVYYRSASDTENYPGDFYDCVTTTTAGDSPESAAAKWTKVEIPLLFERYLTQGVYADWVKGEGQNDKFREEDRLAELELAKQVQLLRGQQGQRHRPEVVRNS